MTTYRSDIDGLRAVAVVPVVLFHAGFSTFSGGYVGVDVFYVISGYLITSIICEEIERDRFTIVGFYERRIRRIFPALFAVVIAASILATILFLPGDFKDFGQSALSTVFFASNILFWLKSGYFDGSSWIKPLLHTWSLAVEEQFYIFYPLYLVAIQRFFNRKFIPWTIAVLVVSLCLSVYALPRWPSATFYLAPARAWELSIGSLLALRAFPPIPNDRWRDALSLLGLAAIAWAVFTFSAATPFPGLHALFPCIGAGLIIYAGQSHSSLVGRVLSVRALVFTGLISYSLYLWHWPLLVFAKYYLLRDLTLAETLGVLAASLALSIACWRFIERPFRGRSGVLKHGPLFAAAAGVMGLVAAFGLVAHRTGGLPARLPAEVVKLESTGKDRNTYRDRCLYLNRAEIDAGRLCDVKIGASEAAPSFIVWGDSHADALMAGVAAAAGRHGAAGLNATLAMCPPLLGVAIGGAPDCQSFNRMVFETINKDQLAKVVLIARWASYSEGSRYGSFDSTTIPTLTDMETKETSYHAVFASGLERTLEALSGRNREIYLVLAAPEVVYDVPSALARRALYGGQLTIETTVADFSRRQAFVTKTVAALHEKYRFTIIDPRTALCDDTICRVQQDGEVLYYDNHHLSTAGARAISGLFDVVFTQAKVTTQSAIETSR